MVAEVFHFYAGAVDKHYGETIPVAGGVDMTFREPLGVVGLIVPWNFPLNIASWKLRPAPARGNTVVLKPAEPPHARPGGSVHDAKVSGKFHSRSAEHPS